MEGPSCGPLTLQWHRHPNQIQWLGSPQSAVWTAAAGTVLATSDSHYREGAAELTLGKGFFRPESRPARDISVLLARHQRQSKRGPLRWLDLMAGCGIRALRWGLEAAECCSEPVEIWANDGDPDRLPLIAANLQPLPMVVQSSAEPAEVVLGRCVLRREYVDLIDLDAFGSPGPLIQPALQTLRFEGLLLLASTDGRSPTGHDRPGALRNLGAAARVHPASWEMALRHQIALVARQAWMLGRGVQPLVCFSEGRTFRIALRLRRQIQPQEEARLGLLARCEACGAQAVQSLIKLGNWPTCHCSPGQGRWSISGPLWIGALQDPLTLQQLIDDAVQLDGKSMSAATFRLMQRLLADPGEPALVWSTDELARRLGTGGPPPLALLVQALRKAGYRSTASGVMPGQVRTNADLPDLLQICSSLRGVGI